MSYSDKTKEGLHPFHLFYVFFSPSFCSSMIVPRSPQTFLLPGACNTDDLGAEKYSALPFVGCVSAWERQLTDYREVQESQRDGAQKSVWGKNVIKDLSSSSPPSIGKPPSCWCVLEQDIESLLAPGFRSAADPGLPVEGGERKGFVSAQSNKIWYHLLQETI